MSIAKKKSVGAVKAKLRLQATEHLRDKAVELKLPQSENDTLKLVHELAVHQVELEMQNAELLQSRDEAETALENYTDLYDFAPDGYMTLDKNGVISRINLTAAGFLGIERALLIGRHLGQFVKDKNRSGFNIFLETIFASGRKETCEVPLLSKGDLPFIVLIEAIVTNSGQECRLALIDITARRQAEEALKDSESRMYKLTEMTVDAIIMLDDSGMITFCNAAVERMFGCSTAEIIGRDFHQMFIPKRLLADAKEGFRSFREHGTGKLIGKMTEVVALRKNGTEFPLELTISALNFKGQWHAIAIMRDITERKQLEAEIQDAREYAENIVETVRRPLLVLSSDLKILSANQNFYHTFLVTPEETIGRSIYDLGNKQWDTARLRQHFMKVFLKNDAFIDYQVEHDFQKIGRRIFLINARIIFQKNIAARIILLAMEDITVRKQLEAEVQDAREYAESIVETVREPLVVLNSDLKVLTANNSFYDTFKVTPEATIGNFIYDLGNRQWDIPRLRVIIEEIISHNTVINDYEVEHDFPDIGHKIILLNARQIFREKIGSRIILLAMEDITARKQLEAEIQDAREYAENIVETVREPLVVLNSDLKILTANHSFYETFKVTPEATIGNYIYDIGNRQWDIPKLRILVEEILPHDTVINDYEVVHDFPGIGRKIILLNARQIFRENIGSHIILLAMEDITARKLVEQRIAEVMRQQQAILDNIPNIAWLKDRDGTYVAVNVPFSKAIGMSPAELVGKTDYDIYPQERALKYEQDFKMVMATGTRAYIEECIVNQKGKTRYVEKIKTPIFNDAGEVIGVIGISHDVTNRKEVEVSLRHDSTHDALTGLYNRAFFEDELERFAHSRMFPLSIVMADVNGLKTVNDTSGHDAGDNLIRLVARIILGAFRSEDIVARIGGDEFVVLLPQTDATVAEEAVERIMNCPEILTGQVSIAFGIATAEHKDQLTEALKLSDERMYRDKSTQKKRSP